MADLLKTKPLEMLRAEVKQSMQLMGCSSVRDLDQTWLMPARDGSSPVSSPR